MERKFVIVGMILIVFSIVLGAFGAHALKEVLKDFPEKLSSFETGVRYQMYSGFAFLIVGLNADKFQFSLNSVFGTWLIGTLFFSVSIYFLAIQNVLGVSLKFLGPITPLGGLLLISGWISLLLKFLKQPKNTIQNQTSNIKNSTSTQSQSPTPNTVQK
jgi:uncharacterized membrane protein YgdD (TMEM256/DUF423 family)